MCLAVCTCGHEPGKLSKAGCKRSHIEGVSQVQPPCNVGGKLKVDTKDTNALPLWQLHNVPAPMPVVGLDASALAVEVTTPAQTV